MKAQFVFLLGLVFITNCYALSNVNDCKNEIDENGALWTKVDGRSQGGGWIWFTGVGDADNRSTAYLKSEGQAIGRLIQECRVAHKKATFNERCLARGVLGGYVAYSRIAIRAKECEESKNRKMNGSHVSDKLLSTFDEYKKQFASSENLKCSNSNPDKCSDLYHYEKNFGNVKDADRYAGIGCMFGKVSEIKTFELCLLLASKIDDVLKRNSILNKTMSYHVKACDNDKRKSCMAVGWVNHFIFNQLQFSIKFFKKGCSLKNQVSCSSLAAIFKEQGLNKEYVYYAREACELEDANSCVDVGVHLSRKQVKKSLPFFLKACDLEDGLGCRNVGLYFGKKQSIKAEKYFAKGCSLSDGGSCGYLGLILEKKNEWVKIDKYFKKACDLNDGIGCLKLGQVAIKKRSFLEAEIKLKKACKLGGIGACGLFGMVLYELKNISESKSVSLRACSSGDGVGCGIFADILFEEKKYAESDTFYEKACELDIGLSCNNLGLSFLKKDRIKAEFLFEKACDLKNGIGCRNLGILFSQIRDKKRTLEYLKKGCNLQDNTSCDTLKRINQK